MNFRHLHLFILPVVLILFALGANVTFGQDMERPTGDDLLLATRYKALAAELNTADSPSRELLNERSAERIAAYLQTLTSGTDVYRWNLNAARRYVRNMLPRLEALKNLAPPAPYSVAQRQEKIQLDGKLEEAAWQQAKPLAIQYHQLEKIEGNTATVRLLWDERFLYAAFEVPDANIIAPPTARDGEVWKTDCVELFLLPDRKARNYWEIEISAGGSVYDSLCQKYPDQWGSDMKVDKTMDGLQFAIDLRGTLDRHDDRDEGYTVEIAIPFDQLPGFPQKPGAGDRLYALLCRVDRNDDNPDAPTLPVAQVPWASWFHNIWAYQPLVLTAPER